MLQKHIDMYKAITTNSYNLRARGGGGGGGGGGQYYWDFYPL